MAIDQISLYKSQDLTRNLAEINKSNKILKFYFIFKESTTYTSFISTTVEKTTIEEVSLIKPVFKCKFDDLRECGETRITNTLNLDVRERYLVDNGKQYFLTDYTSSN